MTIDEALIILYPTTCNNPYYSKKLRRAALLEIKKELKRLNKEIDRLNKEGKNNEQHRTKNTIR